MITPTEQHLGEALEELVSTQPFQPDISSIQRRGRILRRRSVATRAVAGVAVTAMAALVAVTVTGTTQHGTNTNVATSSGAHSSPVASPGVHPVTVTGHNHALIELAAYISVNATHQAGDATLVARTQSYPSQRSIQGFDLYTDSGEYFYAETESGLPAAIESNANQGDGMFAREIAAAEFAVNGSLAVADQRMAYAPFADGKPPTNSGQTAAQRAQEAQMIAEKLAAAGIKDPHLVQMAKAGSTSFNTENYIWEDSEDALQAGAGNPQVRAGVLRILSTLPDITVTHTRVGGQPALAITADGSPDLPTNYHETITVNASTGIPISLVGGANGAAPGVTVTFQVSRVTVSAIEAGRF
jgi:hypothetical protein